MNSSSSLSKLDREKNLKKILKWNAIIFIELVDLSNLNTNSSSSLNSNKSVNLTTSNSIFSLDQMLNNAQICTNCAPIFFELFQKNLETQAELRRAVRGFETAF